MPVGTYNATDMVDLKRGRLFEVSTCYGRYARKNTVVTTQDTAGILRRTSGTRVSGTIVVSISGGWAQYRVFQTKKYVFFVVSCVRSSRAAISDFLGCFF